MFPGRTACKPGTLGGMQWHRGNIGSMLAPLPALIIAVAALIRSPGTLRDWRARQLAEADAALLQPARTAPWR